MAGKGAWSDLRRPSVRRAGVEVARTDFDPTDPATIADPFPGLARLREHPVAVNEKLGVWMIARHDDVSAAARAPVVLSSAMGVLLRSAPIEVVPTTDPPVHDRLRRVISPIFTPGRARKMESDLREFVTPGIAALAEGHVVDAVPAITVPLPVSAIASLLGVPREHWPNFRAWSDEIARIFGISSLTDFPILMSRSMPAMSAMRNLVVAELAARKPGDDDMIGLLRRARDAGEMTDEQVIATAIAILFAGNETTTNLIGMLLLKLARDPELFDRLRDNRDLIPNAVEEMLRWGSPVQWLARYSTAPYPIGGTVIPARSRVVLLYAGANRDPAKHIDPDTFDIDRKSVNHLGFGQGTHFCLGAHLARVEARVALNVLFDQVQHLEIAGPVEWTTAPSLSGPTKLPMRAVPA